MQAYNEIICQRILKRINEFEDLLLKVRSRITVETNILERDRLKQDERVLLDEIERLKIDFNNLKKEENENFTAINNSQWQLNFLVYTLLLLSSVFGLITFNFSGEWIIFFLIILIAVEKYNNVKQTKSSQIIATTFYFLLLLFYFKIFILTHYFVDVFDNFKLIGSNLKFLDSDEHEKIQPIISLYNFICIFKYMFVGLVILILIRIFKIIKLWY